MFNVLEWEGTNEIMLEKKTYANGQRVYRLENENLTYFFKDGTIKSEGSFINDQMEGEWTFYRATGQLWQIGHFKANTKHGHWLRYDKDNQIEYDEIFENGKIKKK